MGSHADARSYAIEDGALVVTLPEGSTGLADRGQYVGHRGDPAAPEGVLLVHHGLHVEIQVDRDHPIGKDDDAGVKDLLLEAAVSTIMDLEDSIAAVDTADKVAAYRNWLLLNRGTLSVQMAKGGESFTRRLAPDREYDGPGGKVVLPGRSLLFVRQVGHLMTTDAVLDEAGQEIPEGILDAVVTALCSLVDLQRRGELRNSRAGSMYAVKPKMHGPDEVAFTDDLFARTEDLLGLGRGTIKLGIMDEERRTSANLKACIHAARGRVAFINTGFLDRTGDELHTSMVGGPMVRKGDMKTAAVDQGLRGPERSTSAWSADSTAVPRSARACGRCPTRWPPCSSRRSGTREAGATLRLGAVADGGDAARAALPPGRRDGTAAGARRSGTRAARAAADGAVRRRLLLVRGGASCRRSRTTFRASSAT